MSEEERDGAGNERSDTTGAETAEKTFRGISQRLAVRYLTNLGGDHVAGDADGEGEDRVEGDGWTATVTSEMVHIGVGSIELTEVTVVFEGVDLEPLVERFSQKAMRAGG
jgi:hypothetical protein